MIAFKKRLQAVARRISFRLVRYVRRARPNDGRLGQLLSPNAANANVVLIWALDVASDDTRLVELLEQFQANEVVILVISDLDVKAAGASGCVVEALPNLEMQKRQPTKDWSVYLTRRVARIRESWAPDFEFSIETSPAEFCSNVPKTGKFSDPRHGYVTDEPDQ